MDGAYRGIPEPLQARIDRARGDGALRRPALDRSFDVLLDRLTFTKPQLDAVRYARTFRRRDDPGPRPGAYAVLLAGAGTFTPFLDGDEIPGGRVGIDPSAAGKPRFDRLVRLATARMVGFRGGTYDDDPRTYLALTRLPMGNRAPNVDP